MRAKMPIAYSFQKECLFYFTPVSSLTVPCNTAPFRTGRRPTVSRGIKELDLQHKVLEWAVAGIVRASWKHLRDLHL